MIKIPNIEKVIVNAFITDDFAVVDYVETRVEAIYSKLAKDLKSKRCTAFTCSEDGILFCLWTNSLKNDGIQKTTFIERNGYLMAMSDVQIESEEDLFKEMEFGTEITVFGENA